MSAQDDPAPLRCFISAPFRTLLSIDSECAYAEIDAFRALLRAILPPLSTAGAYTITAPLVAWRPGGTKFTSLDADSASFFATPIAQIALLDSAAAPGPAFTIRAAHAVLFDNTIGIIEIDLDIATDHLPPDCTAAGLEESLTALAQNLALRVNTQIAPRLLAALLTALKSRKFPPLSETLLRRPPAGSVFDVISQHQYPRWFESVAPLCWCNRTYVLPAGAPPPRPDLLRHHYLSHHGQKLPLGAIVHPGINLAESQAAFQALAAASRFAQYFYALLDILGEVQLGIFKHVARARGIARLVSLSHRFNVIESMIAFAINERVDHLQHTQAERREVLDALYDAFCIQYLQRVLIERGRFIDRRLQLALQAARLGRDTVIQIALFTVGALQVLSAAIALFAYGHDVGLVNRPGWFGLLDILKHAPFNDVTDALFLSILSGIALIFVWNRSK